MITSPCINICTYDKNTWTCTGCFRTADEIAQWPTMTEHERTETLKRCQQRAIAVKYPLSTGQSHGNLVDNHGR